MANQIRKGRTPRSELTPLPEAEVLDSLPTQLARLYHGFVALVDRLRAEDADRLSNFRPGAGSVYFTLLTHEGCTAKELAERLRMPKATISGLLDNLERDGVVARVPCPEDGRAVRLSLTPFGRSLKKRLMQRHQRATRLLEAGLSQRDSHELRRLLRHVLGNLDDLRGADRVQAPAARVRPRRRAA
jgi:DNA-binding MarR family transcriptional regulator